MIVYNDKHWKSFFEVIGEPQRYHQDERFNSAAARAEHYDTIYRFVSEALASRTTKQWLQILGAAEIPCAPVNSVEDLFDDEHLRSTGFSSAMPETGSPSGRRACLRLCAAGWRQGRGSTRTNTFPNHRHHES